MTQIRKIYQCIRPNCRFRFHDQNQSEVTQRCPKCGSPLKIKILELSESDNPGYQKIQPLSTFHILLDNIRSTFNVGSIFRTANGAGGVVHIHLCGVTPSPDHPKISKTALGAEHTIPWTQHWNSLDTILRLKAQGLKIFAVEENQEAVNLFEQHLPFSQEPIVLVLGSEANGVDPEILKICDKILMIPMAGSKRSLNVASAFSILIYHLQYG